MLLSCPAFILKKSVHSTHSHCVPSSKNLAACQGHIDTVIKLHMEEAKYTLASWPVFAHWYVIGLHGMLSEAVSISVIAYTRNIRDNRCPVRSSHVSVHGRGAGRFFLFPVTSTMVLWLVHPASYPIDIADCFFI